MMNKLAIALLILLSTTYLHAQKYLTDFVNPFLGTATLLYSIDLGYEATHGYRSREPQINDPIIIEAL